MFPDLVLAVRGQKNGGGGRGKERRKRDLAKYDCVRVRVGQNPFHASTAHALNLACFHVMCTDCQYTDIEFDTALRFALKTWFSKFKA